ncbi:subclass B1 metallo-beta-lactamase [Spirosoma spitsbergense]|uniref:subclass B1 metallo-beta-lactamase n=1 Tax=Spirosoma spitsbergense TaxID=431554 RepID=UPI000372B014|nr:subclass B1 metallo-beta-lactamase [Spirosoma spitsbergense]
MVKFILLLTLLVSRSLFFSDTHLSKQNPIDGKSASGADFWSKKDSTVYKSEDLRIQKFSDHVYVHTSFLNTDSFGRVACNGMIIINGNEAVIFDTPADNKSSEELIQYVTGVLKTKVNALIPTHFHADCVGGLETFSEHNIPAYASNKTIALLKSKGQKFTKPMKGFDGTLTLPVGDKKVYAEYFGEGHTKDNVIGYFPDGNALFGGCLIKEVGATKGNLEDANVVAWPGTVSKLKQKHPQAKIVVPGHGKSGGTELLEYTIHLFQ